MCLEYIVGLAALVIVLSTSQRSNAQRALAYPTNVASFSPEALQVSA
jgi:hypothetical protein